MPAVGFPGLSKNTRYKKVLRIGLGFAAVYAALSAGLYYAMCQTPSEFGRIMAKVPMPLMAVLPFEPMWNIARAGDLEIGDAAPDFTLPAQHQDETVRLSDFRGEKPVVLIFGSYT